MRRFMAPLVAGAAAAAVLVGVFPGEEAWAFKSLRRPRPAGSVGATAGQFMSGWSSTTVNTPQGPLTIHHRPSSDTLGSWGETAKVFHLPWDLRLGIDDYQYSYERCTPAGNCDGNDEWNFTKRQCVSFVAHRLSQRGVILNGADYGDAGNWATVAVGRNVAVDETPRVGDVAHWEADESKSWTDANGGSHTMGAGSYGHVAYVTAVNADGTVNIEEYNQFSEADPDGDESYHQQFSIVAPRYIHF